MTRALSFTEASLARAAKGLMRAGLHVIGVRPDGTLIVSEKPIDPASFVPRNDDNAPDSRWEDRGA